MIRHLNGDIETSVRYISLGSNVEVLAGEINISVFSVQILFKILKLDGLTKGV